MEEPVALPVMGSAPANEPGTGAPPAPTLSPLPTNWRDEIPKDKRFSKDGNDRLARFKDQKDIAVSYLELETAHGRSVRIPDEKSTPQEKEEFYKKLGRPDDENRYTIEYAATDQKDELLEKKIKSAAFGSGVTQDQLTTLAKAVNEVGTIRADEIKKLNDSRWTTLKSGWGETKTEENIELAKRAFDEFAPKELKNLMTRDDVVNDPILVDMYQNIWRKTMDDTLVRGVQPKEDTSYRPRYYESPEMYRNARTEEELKAKKWFETIKGYKY